MEKTDVVIVGAGGAGMFCGARAAARGRNVILLDHSDTLGRKILISGGGRCNFTNIGASPRNYVSQNEHFCKSAMAKFSPQDFIALVEKYRIPYHEKKLGQLFCDDSAKRIVQMLRSECEKNGAEIRLLQTDISVEKIDNAPYRFLVKTATGEIFCRSLVVATGGLSIPKIGATDFGHKLARKFGIKVTELSPALVSLDMSEEFRRTYGKISGVAIPAKVSCGKISFLENILFTHFGLSGPAILQISLHWHSGEMIRIQLHPDIKWEEKIQSAKKSNPRQNIFDFLSQILPKSFVEVLLAEFKTPPTLQELSHQQIRLLANRLENWELIPTSTGGYSKAEVTRGGVSTDELQSATLESRKIPGLYFIGEVVDVSGWLGGYNFQWAWASGCAAAEAL